MNRRFLLSGGAAIAAMAALRGTARAVPPPAPRMFGQQIQQLTRSATVQVCAGNTQFSLPDDLIDDTTDNSLNSRKICYAPKLTEIADIVLAYPGFGLNNPEQDLPGAYSVAASIEYPLGTAPRPVFFSGAPSAVVNPGRVLVTSDPCPITIRAGDPFAIRTYAAWTPGHFWLTTYAAAQLLGEYTVRGTNVANLTLTNTAPAGSSSIAGFGPVVYGTLAGPVAAVGLIGDSIGSLTGDWCDTTVGFNGWGRAMRGMIPFINLARNGDSFGNYFSRPEGRNLVLRNSITHCIWEMGGNDLFGGAPLAVMQSNIQQATLPFLDRGVKCYAITYTPRSYSTDGWMSAANQTPWSTSVESVRVAYNEWLRLNWAGIGLSGIFDLAHAVDPGDTGKWGFTPGGTYSVPGPCLGQAVLSGGVITSVANFQYNNNSSAGGGYPPGSIVIPCTVNAYPNTGGGGAVVNAVTDPANPWVANYTVVNGGAGYTYPPMISTVGNWTGDGVHPGANGWNQILTNCGNIAPETFTF